MAQVIAMTAPARPTLARLGTPTGRLLIGHWRCDTGDGWFDHGNAVHLEDRIGRWSQQALSTAGGGARATRHRRRRSRVEERAGCLGEHPVNLAEQVQAGRLDTPRSTVAAWMRSIRRGIR
jgi:hypothetical protein